MRTWGKESSNETFAPSLFLPKLFVIFRLHLDFSRPFQQLDSAFSTQETIKHASHCNHHKHHSHQYNAKTETACLHFSSAQMQACVTFCSYDMFLPNSFQDQRTLTLLTPYIPCSNVQSSHSVKPKNQSTEKSSFDRKIISYANSFDRKIISYSQTEGTWNVIWKKHASHTQIDGLRGCSSQVVHKSNSDNNTRASPHLFFFFSFGCFLSPPTLAFIKWRAKVGCEVGRRIRRVEGHNTAASLQQLIFLMEAV